MCQGKTPQGESHPPHLHSPLTCLYHSLSSYLQISQIIFYPLFCLPWTHEKASSTPSPGCHGAHQTRKGKAMAKMMNMLSLRDLIRDIPWETAPSAPLSSLLKTANHPSKAPGSFLHLLLHHQAGGWASKPVPAVLGWPPLRLRLAHPQLSPGEEQSVHYANRFCTNQLDGILP